MFAALVFLVTLGPLCQTPPADEVTFESPCVSVRDLVAELGRQTHRELEAQEMDERLLVVRYDHVPLAQVMTALAQAEVGAWVPSRGKLIFRPDPAKAEKILEEHIRTNTSVYERLINRVQMQISQETMTAEQAQSLARQLGAILDKKDDHLQKFLSEQELSIHLPAERMSVRCLVQIGAERLAHMKPFVHVVFSSNPTSLQGSLEDSAGILEEFNEEQKTWLTHSAPVLANKFRPFFIDPAVTGDKSVGFLAKLFPTGRDYLNYPNLTLFDASGNVTGELYGQSITWSRKFVAEEEAEIKRNKDSKIFADVSPLTEQILKQNGPWSANSDYRRAILWPDKENLLGLGPGSEILSSAKALALNLTVPLVDDLVPSYENFFVGHQLRAQWVLFSVTLAKIPERKDDIGWFVRRPSPWDLGHLSRPVAPLKDFGAYARQVEQSHEIKLDDYASWYAESVADVSHGKWVFSALMGALKKHVSNLKGAGILDSIDPIDLYGVLPERLRAEARIHPVGLASLPDWAAAVYMKHLMDRPIARPGLPNNGSGTIWTEPTIFFASPASKNGTLKLDDEEYDTYQWRSPETGGWREATPVKHSDSTSQTSLSAERSAAPDHFRAVHGHKIKITLTWPTATCVFTITDDEPTGPVVDKKEDLPEAVRD